MTLPIALEDLLNARAIESDRLEFKEGWNPDKVYQSLVISSKKSSLPKAD